MTWQPEARPTILTVDDDPETLDLYADALEPSGYRLLRAQSGSEALALLQNAGDQLPDLIVLDLKLPDEDGLVLCADLKARADVPIIICSGSEEVRDRILGLKLGADDFISKPFNVGELRARVEAVLRRAARASAPPAGGAAAEAPRPAPVSVPGSPPATAAAPPEYLRLGELLIDPTRPHVTLAGKSVSLSLTEHRLLCVLATRPGEVLSRDELALAVWGHLETTSRSLDVHIHNLREKLNEVTVAPPVAPPQIVSVRGFGYKLLPPEETPASA